MPHKILRLGSLCLVSDTELPITQPLELEPKGEDKSRYTLTIYGNSLTTLYFSR